MKRTGKAPAGIMIAGLVALGLVSQLAAAPGQDFKLTVRVFRIPREQNFEAVFLDGKGHAVPFQAHGDVTGDFPCATVFFQTELAANASGEAVAAAILDRVVFGNGRITTRRIQIDEFKAMDLELGGATPGPACASMRAGTRDGLRIMRSGPNSCLPQAAKSSSASASTPAGAPEVDPSEWE